ncbi:MAG: helix-turn-helix domain-containing protein [Lachnospiraceae bacterium]|nr:helix-turn-helix domain-containing protein [Lachnospiraceae bacterium]
MNEIESQSYQIREYLLQGNTITAMEALRLFGCFRLSGRIYDLRKEGINISTTIIKINGKRVAEYSIINEPVEQEV